MIKGITNFPVARAAPTAHRGGGRTARKIDIELLLESGAKLVAFQLVQHLAEGRSIGDLVYREAATLRDFGIVRINARQGLALDKFRHHHILERVV